MQAVLTFIKSNVRWGLALAVGLSLTLLLVGIFGLAGWAEAASWHHATQHVLIFVAGLGAGASGLALKQSREDSHES